MSANGISVAAPAPKIPGMHDRDRFKLIGGPYRMPRCKVDRFLRCSIRGKVRVRGIHEAPIRVAVHGSGVRRRPAVSHRLRRPGPGRGMNLFFRAI